MSLLVCFWGMVVISTALDSTDSFSRLHNSLNFLFAKSCIIGKLWEFYSCVIGMNYRPISKAVPLAGPRLHTLICIIVVNFGIYHTCTSWVWLASMEHSTPRTLTLVSWRKVFILPYSGWLGSIVIEWIQRWDSTIYAKSLIIWLEDTWILVGILCG